jgi:predicted amidophosphoribosyltransferase
VAEDPVTAWNGVFCLRDYNPYKFGGSRNPSFVKATDGRLLDFKEGQDYAVKAETKEFAAGLEKLKLPKGTILVVVPGHEAKDSNAGRPLALVADALAQADGRYVARVDMLIRTQTIPKLAKGGNRSVQVHLNSMTVSNPALLKGKTVVVLDDTVTSEGSLTAARALLSQTGAAVAAVGLGRTVKYL